MFSSVDNTFCSDSHHQSNLNSHFNGWWQRLLPSESLCTRGGSEVYFYLGLHFISCVTCQVARLYHINVRKTKQETRTVCLTKTYTQTHSHNVSFKKTALLIPLVQRNIKDWELLLYLQSIVFASNKQKQILLVQIEKISPAVTVQYCVSSKENSPLHLSIIVCAKKECISNTPCCCYIKANP